jgi:hypothetical protein
VLPFESGAFSSNPSGLFAIRWLYLKKEKQCEWLPHRQGYLYDKVRSEIQEESDMNRKD